MKEELIVLLTPCLVLANVLLSENATEDIRVNFITDLIAFNIKNNGWNNIITYGHLPDSYYNEIKQIPLTFITSNSDEDDFYIEDPVLYHSNVVLINCHNFTNFEDSLRQVMNLPYWHPLASVIILYYKEETEREIARMFYILWFYKASNAIIVQFDENSNAAVISQYNPFVVDQNSRQFGCRTVRNIGLPINTFDEGFVCEDNCQNVSFTSKHRALRYGTCIEFKSHRISERNELKKLNLFEDRGKNMNGFALRSLTIQVLPFMIVKLDNGSYTLDGRDGLVWNALAEQMNFTVDVTPCADVVHNNFNFETNVQQIFDVAQRKGDIFLIPIYQFDLAIVEVDFSFPYKESGVCFLAHRAAYETVLFDLKTLQDNFDVVIEFAACVICIWFIFFLYSVIEADTINADLIGKNIMNTVRSILSLTLYNPPRRQSFRIFLAIILWSFFVINFSTQAAIISFFAASKRGKEVETYSDIVEKGYPIQGLATPDVVLPDDDELFRKINSKLEPISDLLGCVKAMTYNYSSRFCLIDCSVGYYYVRNKLDSRGEQYLHIAKDRVHNYYLNLIFQKHSIMTDSANKYLMKFYEAGLFMKWEQYRFTVVKDESPVKPLGMEETKGIFQAYVCAIIITTAIFLLEVIIGNYNRVKSYCTSKLQNWKRTRKARKIVKLERKQNKITKTSSSTQTY